jgi:hypothetical protein
MREPREALDAARKAGAAAPVDKAEERPASLERAAAVKQLMEWAIIEPDQSEVYSTRRFGRPITAFKRLLIRLLYQYLGQMSAQQSRFNAHMAVHALRLEGRMNALEDAVSASSSSQSPSESGARPDDGSGARPDDGSGARPDDGST